MPSPRVRRLVRWTVALALVIAALATVVLVASSVLNRGPVRAWLARRIAQELTSALAQPVRVGDVRVSVLPPRVALQHLELGPGDAPMVTVRVAEVAVGKIRLRSREVVVNQLRLAGVRVRGDLPEPPPQHDKGGAWVQVKVRQLEVEDAQIDRLALPGGVTLKAEEVEARWSGSPRTPIQAAVLRGRGITVKAPGVEASSLDLEAWGRRSDAGFEMRRLRAVGDGWELTGTGVIGASSTRLDGEAEVDLGVLDRTVHVRAGLAGRARLDWNARLENDEFKVESQVEAAALQVVGFDLSRVSGEILVSRDGIEGSLRSAQFAGGTVAGTYTLTGFGPPWRHRVVATGEDISLASFLSAISVPSAGLSAACRMNAEVDWDGTRIKEGYGTAIVDLHGGDGPVPLSGSVALSLEADGALHADSRQLRVAGAPAAWQGQLLLGSWVPTWAVRGESVAISAVAHLLSGWVGTAVLPEPLHGLASFDVRIRGPFHQVTVVGDVDAAPIGYGPAEVDRLTGSFRVADGAVTVEEGQILLGQGAASVTGAISLGEETGLDLSMSGDAVAVRDLIAWAGFDLPIDGTVGFDGAIEGTLAQPVVKTGAVFHNIAVAGVPFGDGSGSARLERGVVSANRIVIGPFSSSLTLDFAQRRATLQASLQRFGLDGISPLLARLAGSGLDLELTSEFPFDAPTGRLEVSSAGGAAGFVDLDAEGLSVALERSGVWRIDGSSKLVDGRHLGQFTYAVQSLADFAKAVAGEDVSVEGDLEGRARVEIEPGSKPVVEGTVTRLRTVVQGDQFDLASPVDFTVKGNAVTVDNVRLAGANGTLEARLSREANGALAATAKGRLPVSLVGLLWPEGRLSGTADVTVSVSGSERRPVIVGTAVVADGSMLLPGLPAPLTHVDGTFDFVPEAIRLRDVRFALGSGRGTGNGRIVLDPRVELDVETRVSSLRWNVFGGFTPSVTGSIRIVGPLGQLSVSGDTTLERTVFREEINLQRLVLQQLLGTERAVSEDSGAIALNLQVAVPRTLEIDTPLARVTMRGQLRVLGTSAQPGLVGQLEMMPGGELELSGQRYELERGSITFSDPDRINPYLDILAQATIQSVEITIGLVGTLDRLTPTLVSNPPLPETDILALLSTGRRADEASEAQAGVLAGSFLTEQIAGAFARRARTLLDVDQLRVDPFAATETGSPTARVTVVKQLSSDWTVTVSTNLAANREEVIQSRWRLGQGLFLQASRDIDGSYSMEVKWQRRY